MKMIKCYLCGDEAIQYNTSTSLDLQVKCPICGNYELTHKAIYYYFKRENKKQILNQEDKEKLSLYVQKKYDTNYWKPVIIDTQVIQGVTGKMSIEMKY